MGKSSKKTEEEIKKEKENQVKKEIFDTEISYNTAINRLNDLFLKPLREAFKKDKNLQKNKKIEAFLKEADKILPIILRSNNILKELKDAQDKKMDGTISNGSLAEIFITYAPHLTVFAAYAVASDKLSELWKEIKQTKEIVKLEEKFKNASAQIDVLGHLIMPVQRGPRYAMLFNELLKYMRKSDASYEKIKEAHEIIMNVMDYTNEFKRQSENSEWKKEFQKSLKSAYTSLTNKKLRSVEFSRSPAFFKLSSIGYELLKTSLKKKFPSSNVFLSENTFSKNECYVTVSRKNHETGKEKEFKFKILKGKAGTDPKGKEESNFFNVRIEHDLNTLTEKERKMAYDIAEEIGGSVINSIKEKAGLKFEAKEFKIRDPGRTNQFEELKSTRLEEKRKDSLIFSEPKPTAGSDSLYPVISREAWKKRQEERKKR